MTTTQLQRVIMVNGSEITRARRMRAVLQRLRRERLVHQLRRRIGGIQAGSDGTVYRLSGRGIGVLNREDGIERRRVGREPGERYVRHVLAVSELFVIMTELTRGSTDELLTFEAEPQAWRTYTGPHGGRIGMRPDGFVRTASGQYEHTSFVEIDLATRV